jgi:hypothetical protein
MECGWWHTFGLKYDLANRRTLDKGLDAADLPMGTLNLSGLSFGGALTVHL